MTMAVTAGLLATLALAPGTAGADEGPLAPAAGNSVELKAGQDYALVGASDMPDTIDLLDPAGRVVASVDTIGDLSHGTEFRARYSARYSVRDRHPDAVASWAVVPDCRGDARTLCRIAVGSAKIGHLTWPSDRDWRAAVLRAGRTYTIAPDGINTCVSVADARGRRVSAWTCAPDVLSYRPPRTGSYFVAVSDDNIDEGVGYGVALRLR